VFLTCFQALLALPATLCKILKMLVVAGFKSYSAHHLFNRIRSPAC